MPTIIQISDCHLLADPEGDVRGIRTRETLRKVWRHLREHYPEADRIVISGDLTHDERVESYEAVREITRECASRILVIPGNHDDRPLLRKAFAVPEVPGLDRVVFVDEVGAWRLIGLDSHVPGKLHGELGEQQLQWLDRALSAAATPTVLFMHHPPISVESPWLDKINLQDACELQHCLLKHPQVKLICCGHVHQQSYGELNKIPVKTVPSTGVQFRRRTESLEIDDVQPGYYVLSLEKNGRHDSRVERTHLLDDLMLLDEPHFGVEFYEYLIDKMAREDELTPLEREAYLLTTLMVDIEMTGLINVFHQTFSLSDCDVVEAGLKKLGLHQLADQFQLAKSIYLQGRSDVTEKEYRSIDFWGDLSETEQQRFDEINKAVVTGDSGFNSIRECLERYVKSQLRRS